MNRTSLITIVFSLVLTLGLASCGSTPDRESTGEFFDSSLITAKVKAKLIDDKITGGYRINVSTYKSVVYLHGYVNSEFEKHHATTIVNSVDGVKGVKNNLVVRSETNK